ncbi:MAG: DUF6279 family lipoprotein [Halopseudomonas sp.]|uniref:DUF6279 family lipoprotein n=1 Tax=Halopseudomonas sp. TaxID=2901191 RepID=UPI003003146A
MTYSIKRLARFSGLAACLILLSACSATQLAYRNLDWLISREVNQLVDLTSSQQAWFDNQLQGVLQWHCQTELPRYRMDLQRFGSYLLGDSLDATVIADELERTEDSAARSLQRAAPLFSGLLQRLSDDQVAELRGNMAEQLAEKYEELVEPPLQARREDRIDKLEDQLQRWLGSLNDAQRASVTQWIDGRDGSTEVWLDNRRQWESLLLAELPDRQQPDFHERIRHLIVDYKALRTPAYAQQAPRSRASFAALLSTLMQQATPEQKTHFQKRLNRLATDLDELTCKPGETG